MRALEDAIKVMEDIAVEIDSDDNKLLDQVMPLCVLGVNVIFNCLCRS